MLRQAHSHGSDCPQMAFNLIRPVYTNLIACLTISAIKGLADMLYQREIISGDELTTIYTEKPRQDMARSLLMVMNTRTYEQGLTFIHLLKETEGVEAVADKILKHVNESHSIKDSHRVVGETDTTTLSSGHHEMEITPASVSTSTLIETALRQRLQQTDPKGFHYQGKQPVKWSQLPNLEQNMDMMWTKNRVAAIGNMIVSGCCNERDLYTLNLDNRVTEEWMTHKGIYGPIWNISSYKKACYVTAGEQDRKLYQLTWRAESNTSSWRYMSDLPEILKEGGCFCPVASENHIYMFGGLLKGKPFKTAFVYDIKGDKWMPLPDMPFQSYNCSAVLYDKTLYLAGGRSVDNRGIHDVIAISPHEPSWRSHSVLEYGNATLSAIQDKLIATGGVSCAGGDVKNAYVFDFKSNQWLPLPDMLTPRSKHGACVMNSNSLAVIGGQLNTTCEILTIH